MSKTKLNKKILDKVPIIKNNAFIAPGAKIIGDVFIDDHSSIWYNTVLRGDINMIKVGKNTNIQDNSVVHVENDQGVIIGDYVTIGHNAIIHGCTIREGVLIGMGAIIMNGCIIGKGSIIGAGSLIKENSEIPPSSLVVGLPGKIIKKVDKSTLKENTNWAKKYKRLSKLHKKHGKEIMY